MKNFSISKLSILFISIFIIVISFSFRLWERNRILVDAPSYYTYLPAFVIHGDLKLNFIDRNPDFFKDKIWTNETPDQERVIKHTIGLSVTLLPFFILAHGYALIFVDQQDGYSLIYQNFLSVGVLIYFLLGLYFLRKILLIFFSEKVTAITFVSISLGTNLLWYSTFEGLMNHGVTFSLVCICLYASIRLMENGLRKYFFIFAVCFGLIILIRPLSIILAIYFLLFALIRKGGLKNLLLFLKQNLISILLVIVIVLIIFLPQMFYWKYITGHWFYDSYKEEHFIFSSPMIWDFLFSFRKGWFIYTPVMFIAIVGMTGLYNQNKEFFYSTLIFFLLTVYLYSSWWAWSYGISWGLRPMIDIYGLLSIPFAAGIKLLLSKKKAIILLTYTLLVLLICFNLFQTWQYKNGLLHFDNMTRKAYFMGIFQTKPSWEWYDSLQPYDYNRRKKGKQQVLYNQDFFNNISDTMLFSIRSDNFKLWSVYPQASSVIISSANAISSKEVFYIHKLNGDTVAIESAEGKFLSVNFEGSNLIFADRDTIGKTEKLLLSRLENDENKISLKAMNNKFVSRIESKNDVIAAVSEKIDRNSTFRVYLIEKE